MASQKRLAKAENPLAPPANDNSPCSPRVKGSSTPPPSKTRQFLSTAAAASVLGVAPATLEQWRSRHIGPDYFRVGDRAIRYCLDDLQSFAQRVRVAKGGAS